MTYFVAQQKAPPEMVQITISNIKKATHLTKEEKEALLKKLPTVTMGEMLEIWKMYQIGGYHFPPKA